MSQVLSLSNLIEELPIIEDIETDDELIFPSYAMQALQTKNTFIHYDIPKPASEALPAIPTSSAPGIMLRRLFKTKTESRSGSDTETNATDLQRIRSFSSDSLLSFLGDSTPDSFQGTPLDVHVLQNESFLVNAPWRKESALTTGLAASATPLDQQTHISGKCTPCNYFWYKVDGCRMGSECTFCHICPKGEIKKRKKDKIKELRNAGILREMQ